jgi:hypothetical protein
VRAQGRPQAGLFGLCSCGPVYWLGGGGQEVFLVFDWVFVDRAGEGACGQSLTRVRSGYEMVSSEQRTDVKGARRTLGT